MATRSWGPGEPTRRAKAAILVVDDAPSVRVSCQRVLTGDGHRVDLASSGEEAVRMLRARRYDLALLDLRIPHMGGLTLLQYMRDAYPDTDVIVITGYPTIDNAKESIELGAFDYVLKPLDPDKISTVVSRALACRPWTLRKEVMASSHPEKKRVLIVDDDEVVRRSFERVLAGEGYQVRSARSGTDALAAVDDRSFDVMLADLKMPGMDGLTVIRRMRKTHPDMRVVVITGYPSRDSAREAEKLGVLDYLTKPLAPDALSRATAHALASA